jgi:DNA-binding NtrC family response regulator
LFLDEIGELSLESQKKLLYLLEEKEYTAVGSSIPEKFKGRIIMATNRDLAEMVKLGKFREDLFFRIMIFQIHMEPIRKNPELVGEMIQYYLRKYQNEYSKPTIKMSSELMNLLLNHEWRGNYRELKNCIESMVALEEKNLLTLESIPSWMNIKKIKNANEAEYLSSYWEAMEEFEETYLRFMLIKHNGKINETARQLKISKVSLISKSRKYKINTHKLRFDNHEKVEKMAA